MSGGFSSIKQIKAWVSYNGVTPAINASDNVSSVTKNGSGDYTINFIRAMQDTNYIVMGRTDSATGATRNTTPDIDVQTYSTTSCRILVSDTAGTGFDYPEVQFMVVR